MSDLPDKPASAWFWYFIGMWVLLGVALIILGTGTAHAQQQPLCLPIDQLAAGLAEKFNEQPLWGARSGSGPERVVIFQSPNGETWTLVRLLPTGQGCLIDGGKEAVIFNADKGV